MKGDGCVNQIDSGNHFEVYTHAKTMPCTLNIAGKIESLKNKQQKE